MSVVVIDSGVANLASVTAALKRLDIQAEVTDDAQKIKRAGHVVLPGVGAALPAMAKLKDKGLVQVIPALTQPVLGICLGMQLMFSRSDEGQGCDCLGVIPGAVERLRPTSDKPVPHMGWNQIFLKNHDHGLVRNIDDEAFTYFVHSFAVAENASTIASCSYTQSFSAIVAYENFFGCQFHPERSGDAGAQIFKNFVSM